MTRTSVHDIFGAHALPLTILSLVLCQFVLACSSDDKTPAVSAADAGDADGGGGGDGGSSGTVDGGGGGNGCGGMCKSAKFASGAETDFGNGLVECQCSGTGGEVTKAACEDYCAKIGVSADKAFLSAEPGQPATKCACDGT